MPWTSGGGPVKTKPSRVPPPVKMSVPVILGSKPLNGVAGLFAAHWALKIGDIWHEVEPATKARSALSAGSGSDLVGQYDIKTSEGYSATSGARPRPPHAFAFRSYLWPLILVAVTGAAVTCFLILNICGSVSTSELYNRPGGYFTITIKPQSRKWYFEKRDWIEDEAEEMTEDELVAEEEIVNPTVFVEDEKKENSITKLLLLHLSQSISTNEFKSIEDFKVVIKTSEGYSATSGAKPRPPHAFSFTSYLWPLILTAVTWVQGVALHFGLHRSWSSWSKLRDGIMIVKTQAWEILVQITTSIQQQVDTRILIKQMPHFKPKPNILTCFLILNIFGSVSTSELYNRPGDYFTVTINPSRLGPQFSQSSDPLRYVKVSCQDCFIIEDFKNILSLKVSEGTSPGEFKGLQVVLKDQGLNPTLEVNAPIDPCYDHFLKLTVTFMIKQSGVDKVENRSVFAAYQRDVCISPKMENNLNYAASILSGFALVFTILLLLLKMKVFTRQERKNETLVDYEDP